MRKKPDKTIDVLSHALIPEMDVLSSEEKGRILKKYGVTEKQLPIIFATDPEAVALKAAPGDLVRIKRREDTGEYVTYRIVAD